jgi:hypothetical protein
MCLFGKRGAYSENKNICINNENKLLVIAYITA